VAVIYHVIQFFDVVNWMPVKIPEDALKVYPASLGVAVAS